MNNNNGNGNRPKLDPQLGEEVRVKLLKDKPYIGENGFGKFYLYTVQNVADEMEHSFFAPDYIHNVITEHSLITGSEFILKKVATQNGSKKIVSRLELSLVANGNGNGKATMTQEQAKSNGHGQQSAPATQPDKPKTNGNGNGYKSTMLECLRDAYDISKDPAFAGLPFRTEDIRSIGLTLYISRSKGQA